jgi:hypothetical protein
MDLRENSKKIKEEKEKRSSIFTTFPQVFRVRKTRMRLAERVAGLVYVTNTYKY